MILLVIAGWLHWSWWTPFGVFVLSAGLRIWKLNSIGAWHSNEDLATFPWLGFAISFTTTLAIYLLAYWAGRGVARMMGRSGVPHETPT